MRGGSTHRVDNVPAVADPAGHEPRSETDAMPPNAMPAPPHELGDALTTLAAGPVDVLAGGTDWYPALRDAPPPSAVLDITRIRGLRGIEHGAGGTRIGAAATWTDLIRADLPPAFDALVAAAREVGSVQIQNAATLAGNLCTASPAADGAPPLLALGASVELASARGTRTLPLDDFLRGPRDTALAADELLVAILVPPHRAATLSRFAKLGARRYLVISIAMVAVTLELDGDGTIERAGVAVGSCAPTARRLPILEAALVGRRPDEDLGGLVTPSCLDVLAPIDDVRASGAYRLAAVAETLRRMLDDVRGERVTREGRSEDRST